MLVNSTTKFESNCIVTSYNLRYNQSVAQWVSELHIADSEAPNSFETNRKVAEFKVRFP